MRTLAPLALLFFAGLLSPAAADPVEHCRTAHAGDAGAHIECLESALRAKEPAPEPAHADREAAPEAPTGLGAEQVFANRQTQESSFTEADVRIVSATYGVRGLGTFRMADGQVWRETAPSPERRRLKPDTTYNARVVRGKISGYRLHVEGVRWMKTVERVE